MKKTLISSAIIIFILAVIYFVFSHSVVIWTFTDVLVVTLIGIGIIVWLGVRLSNKKDL